MNPLRACLCGRPSWCGGSLMFALVFALISAAGVGCHNQMTLSDSVSAIGPVGGTGKATMNDGGPAGDGGAGGQGTGADPGGSAGGASASTGGAAGGTCSGSTPGACAAPSQCLSCPSGAITAQYLCSTPCTSDADCTEPAQPHCNQAAPGGAGLCTDPDFVCRWQAKCVSPLTRIATPRGWVPIASLKAGDLVYSVHLGQLAAVPVLRTTRTPAVGHHVVRARLGGGPALEISEGHPTADGRLFGDLAPGDHLGTEIVTSVETVPYRFAQTYDILPASDTGAYFAEGALVGSTLAPGGTMVDARMAAGLPKP